MNTQQWYGRGLVDLEQLVYCPFCLAPKKISLLPSAESNFARLAKFGLASNGVRSYHVTNTCKAYYFWTSIGLICWLITVEIVINNLFLCPTNEKRLDETRAGNLVADTTAF